MKFKTTLILLVVFLGLLAVVLFVDKKGKNEKAGGPEEKLVALKAADVEKITLKKEDETLNFKKDDKGEWMISGPLEAKADNVEVNQLAENFADLRIERVVEKENGDLKKYQIPKKEVTLWLKGNTQPVKVLVGMENPLDNTYFAQKEGDKRVVLLPSTLKSTFDKKLFDFRQKDVFKFETGDVKTIKLQAKDIQWEAQKKDGEWFFEKPLRALAKESKITNILDSLSNLKAKEFIGEDKKADELKKLGLDKPEYQITLTMPAANKELVFALHKDKEKTYATTSQSTKVIVPESDILTDLEKKADELRENKVVIFNTWQASKVLLKKGGLGITLTKASNDKWYFDPAQKQEAEGSKIETFVRKIESLEAAEYVDAPKALATYGLDKPQAEVTIWTKETGEKPIEKSLTIFVGSQDKDKKQAFVKNSRLDYLFKVDSAFLDEFPKEAKDWKAPEPEKKEPEKKK
jgi:Domain of unknown function (DUF4340)